jgi:hypothetical protein
VKIRLVSELCHIPPQTPGEHRDLRGHSNAHRCVGKSLIGSALVGLVRAQHARRESISTRARSTTSDPSEADRSPRLALRAACRERRVTITVVRLRTQRHRSRCRDAVLVTDRGGQPLQRGRQEGDPRSPSTSHDRQACRTARQDARSNRAPLAHRAWVRRWGSHGPIAGHELATSGTVVCDILADASIWCRCTRAE